MTQEKFKQSINAGYSCQSDFITMGVGMLEGAAISDTLVNVPLKSLNRHGLIAGATGTGKTKTVQLLCELLSDQGVPTLVMDLKGDLSGLGAAGQSSEKITERQSKIGIDFTPTAFPVELMTISDEPGARLRATVSEFGPVLFTKMLGLNDTQGGIMAVIFKYCQDKNLPLLDLRDLKKVLNHVMDAGKTELEAEYGKISSSSVGTIQRKILELEQQGANTFFGEPTFMVNDLLRQDPQSRGIINILRLVDLQDRPKLFSTFMLSLLSEVYREFPEVGDLPKPKLVIIIDEAHLIFNEASSTLLSKIETIIKLIRSKGVGIFFCTQNPTDVPNAVLSQLGMKVQHALRAFTPKDRQAIKLTAQNYPSTEFYQTDQLLTKLGIGEAVITVLDEKGRPTPLVATLLQAPRSRMAPLSEQEVTSLTQQSMLANKYNQKVDRESAYEILNKRVEAQAPTPLSQEEATSEESAISQLSKNTLFRQIMRTLAREATRAIMSALGIKNRRR